MITSIIYNGLGIDGTVEYDPGQPVPSYSCGGVPPSWDVEIQDISLDDADDFLSTGILADLADKEGWSNGVHRMVEEFIRITHELPEVVEQYAMTAWEHYIEMELTENA
jgi:hypothetical protein